MLGRSGDGTTGPRRRKITRRASRAATMTINTVVRLLIVAPAGEYRHKPSHAEEPGLSTKPNAYLQKNECSCTQVRSTYLMLAMQRTMAQRIVYFSMHILERSRLPINKRIAA
jgi:hypothetical protein